MPAIKRNRSSTPPPRRSRLSLRSIADDGGEIDERSDQALRVQSAHAITLSLLLELSRRDFPKYVAIMCGPDSPLIAPPRRDRAPDKDLRQALFGEMLRLQGILNISKKGKQLFP